MSIETYQNLDGLRRKVLEQIDYGEEIGDEEVCAIIDQVLSREEDFYLLPLHVCSKIRRDLFFSLRRLDILQSLLEDPEVTEIMVNGPENIFVEKKGKITRWEGAFESQEKLSDVIQQIVAASNRTVNDAHPIADARIYGARVNVVLSSVALNGPILTIRRFPAHPITMEQLIGFGALTQEAASFLQLLVRAKYNIFISGGTGSGKTTFLNVLSGFIPKDERIITIEDNAELQLQGVDNLVRLETRESTVEGCREISIRDLIRCSLRMRPDRIIVGEVRGGEAFDMMQCMNTGHDGSMSTGHANSAKDMLRRLENMLRMGMDLPLEALQHQIASGIDILIHLGRLRDRSRKVLEISEIIGMGEKEILLNPLYLFEEDGEKEGQIQGVLKKKGKLMNEYKLKAAGLSDRY